VLFSVCCVRRPFFRRFFDCLFYSLLLSKSNPALYSYFPPSFLYFIICFYVCLIILSFLSFSDLYVSVTLLSFLDLFYYPFRLFPVVCFFPSSVLLSNASFGLAPSTFSHSSSLIFYFRCSLFICFILISFLFFSLFVSLPVYFDLFYFCFFWRSLLSAFLCLFLETFLAVFPPWYVCNLCCLATKQMTANTALYEFAQRCT
jgi:hypothetical protein